MSIDLTLSDSVISVTITDDRIELTIVDAPVVILRVYEGPRGPAGADGADGAQGPAGVDATPDYGIKYLARLSPYTQSTPTAAMIYNGNLYISGGTTFAKYYPPLLRGEFKNNAVSAFNHMCHNGAGVFYAGGASGGVVKSTDDGVTWTSKPGTGGLINSIAANGNIVVAATNSGLYVSTNGGDTWAIPGGVTFTNGAATNQQGCVKYHASIDRFVVVSGTTSGAQVTGYVNVSQDGVTWTSYVSSSIGRLGNSEVLGGQLYLFGADARGRIYVTDPNAVVFTTKVDNPLESLDGNNGGGFYTSAVFDGTIWLSGGWSSGIISFFRLVDGDFEYVEVSAPTSLATAGYMIGEIADRLLILSGSVGLLTTSRL